MTKRVTYFYDEAVSEFSYGPGHPMKPFRIKLTNELVCAYKLHKKMTILKPAKASAECMELYHSEDYIQFLRSVTPDDLDLKPFYQRYFSGEDNPVFDGMFEFCSISAGGSIGAAKALNDGNSDIAINWAGGLHHAKRGEASGFCYVNDIVLCILELLKYNQRVLYIDIDVHHGDGVEEAFYTTDRVMTVSFHKFGEYFPGTGDLTDIGLNEGRNYSINIPLQNGIDDAAFKYVFEPIIDKVITWYRPSSIVLQCGADSLAGDRLGCFNLSSNGHGSCVEFVKSFKIPLVLLGGGGYSIRNVARTWTYETAIALGVDISNDLPNAEYMHYYGPEYKLFVRPTNVENLNSYKSLDKIKLKVMETLRNLPFAPSAQYQYGNLDIPTLELDQINDTSEEDTTESKPASKKDPEETNEFLLVDTKKRNDKKIKTRNKTKNKKELYSLQDRVKNRLNYKNESDTETSEFDSKTK